jgi:hypothetical protein
LSVALSLKFRFCTSHPTIPKRLFAHVILLFLTCIFVERDLSVALCDRVSMIL